MDKPLVSVAVITYNSSAYVLEGLESIKAQTYQNIELIISDDGSHDDTVEICKAWLNANASRFARTEVITVLSNTGTSANYNRADSACKGIWVLYVDGDDCLIADCVEKYVSFVIDNPNIHCLFANMTIFGQDGMNVSSFKNHDLSFYEHNATEQNAILLTYGCCIPAPTFFHDRLLFEELGITHDETIPIIEDWVRFINMTAKGVKCYHMNETTVMYRVHSGGVSNGTNNYSIFLRSQALTYLKYCFSYRFRHLSKRVEIKNWLNAKIIVTNRGIYKCILYAYSGIDNITARLLKKDPAPVKFGLDNR